MRLMRLMRLVGLMWGDRADEAGGVDENVMPGVMRT
jgi:hypothetical protein